MAKPLLNLPFPVLGLDRRYAYQSQPPYTTPGCLNVRPDGTLEGRQRGGSRPGMGKVYTENIDRVDMLGALDVVTEGTAGGTQFWIDGFEGDTLKEEWSSASWDDAGSYIWNTGLPLIGGGHAYITKETGDAECGVLRDPPANMDASQYYTLSMLIEPYNGFFGGDYFLYCRTSGDSRDGLVVVVRDLYTDRRLRILEYTNGVPNELYSSGDITLWEPISSLLWATINGTNLRVEFVGQGLGIIERSLDASHADLRFGFGFRTIPSRDDPHHIQINEFKIVYHTTDTVDDHRFVVAGGGGKVYAENADEALVPVTEVDTDITSEDLVSCIARTQKLYIADFSRSPITGADGVLGTGGMSLSAESVDDWTEHGITSNPDRWVVALTECAGGAVGGTYTISGVDSGSISLSSSAGLVGGLCHFRVDRGPKVYDPKNGHYGIWTSSTGTSFPVPFGCPLVARFLDRMVLAGASYAPHVWFMSRRGDPDDWDFSQLIAGDVASAIGGQAVIDSGTVGQPLTALAPHSNDYIIFGCRHSLWVLRGDPGYGNQTDNLSHKTGIVGKEAWCWGPNGELVFLGPDGLNMLAPGAEAFPVPVSRERLPRELLNVNTTQYRVLLEYDPDSNGVHISLTNPQDGLGLAYWFDWDLQSFWPVSVPNVCAPTALFHYGAKLPERTTTLFGGWDGHIRRFAEHFGTDDSFQLSSHVLYGPIRLSGNDHQDGILQEINAVLDGLSGQVVWEVYVGESQQAAVVAAKNGTQPFATGNWKPKVGANLTGNYTSHPRARGNCFVLKLSNAGSSTPWAMERITAKRSTVGKQRFP